jgi:Zn-dependent protease
MVTATEKGFGTEGSMFVTFAGAMLLMTATLYALRGGLVSPQGFRVVGTDLQGVGLGATAVLIAAWYFGPLYSLALIFTVMIHEYGHVAAFRVTGHDDARFRLVPLFGGMSVSEQPIATEAEEFFVSIAGPALSLAPMVLAFALYEVLAPVSYPLAKFLWIFAATTAALNFLNLLPLWPLDGGRCVRAVVDALDARAATVVTLAMSAIFAAGAFAIGSPLLFIVALLGAFTIRPAETSGGTRMTMTPKAAVVAFGAYAFTAAAHLAGGVLLLSSSP